MIARLRSLLPLRVWLYTACVVAVLAYVNRRDGLAVVAGWCLVTFVACLGVAALVRFIVEDRRRNLEPSSEEPDVRPPYRDE